MGFGDNMVEKAVSEVFEQSDLEPGELNQRISQVTDMMEDVHEQFDDLENFQKMLVERSENMNKSATQMAEASVAIAEASQALAEATRDFGDNVQELQKSIDQLEQTYDKIEERIPDEE